MHFEIFKKNTQKTEIFHEIFHRQKNMFFTSLAIYLNIVVVLAAITPEPLGISAPFFHHRVCRVGLFKRNQMSYQT